MSHKGCSLVLALQVSLSSARRQNIVYLIQAPARSKPARSPVLWHSWCKPTHSNHKDCKHQPCPDEEEGYCISVPLFGDS